MPSVTPPEIEPLANALRRVESGAALWSRVLHDKRLALLTGHGTLGIVLSPAAGPPKAESYRLELTDGDQLLRVDIGHYEHPALAMAAQPSASEALQRLASQALFSVPLALLDQIGLGRWRPLSLMPRATATATAAAAAASGGVPDASMSAWLAVHREGSCLCLLRFGGDTATLCEALLVRTRALQADRSQADGWRVPSQIVLHRRPYAVALLGTLAIGDVLLMHAIPSGKSGWPVRLRWGATAGRCLEARASLRGNQVHIEETPTLSDDEASGHEADADSLPCETLGELDIPVRFEIETLAMTLSDLAAVGPGYVIELTTPVAAATIRLVACGQTIGHAELVAVGGQLGARITRMVER